MAENKKQWYVDMQSEIVGPVSLDILRDWLRVGTITSETWVRQEGQSEWQPLAIVEELDMSEEDMADFEDLADQSNAEQTPRYLRANESLNGKISERDKLLNRAFGVRCIAVFVLFLGAVYIFIGAMELVYMHHAPPLGVIFLCGLIAIPFLLQYYLLNSIITSLRAITKLMDRLDEREQSRENTKKEN